MRCRRTSAMLLLTVLVAGTAAAEPRAIPFRTQTMGTWATVTVATADSIAVADLALGALLELHHVDSLMTNWTDTSELARLNREAGRGPTSVHPEVLHVLNMAQRVSEDTGGAFDVTVEPLVRLWGFLGGKPRVPQQGEIAAVLDRIGWTAVVIEGNTVAFARPDLRIDLGGVAKGYGADRAAGYLGAGLAGDFLVDISGNMVARGASPGHDGWLLGIRDPQDREPYLATVLLQNESVATSGAYAQFVAEGGRTYGHILDPRTGWPAEGLTSATVVAGTACQADAWATALFVLGPQEARRAAAEHDEIHAVLLEPTGADSAVLWVERALNGRLSLNPAFVGTVTISLF